MFSPSAEHYAAYPLHVFVREVGVERQREDGVRHMLCHGRGIGVEARAPSEALERVRQRVEVLARDDVLRREAHEHLVAGVFIAVEHDGIIGVVALHARLHGVELYSGDAAEARVIQIGYVTALCDLAVEMAQVAYAHRRAELIHLRVAADELHAVRPVYAEILQVVEALHERGVAAAHRAALDGVEHLRRVEREHGRVAEERRAHAVFLHAEGVRRVVEHAQSVRLGDGINALSVTEVAVDVHGQDGDGLVGDEAFYLIRVDGVIVGADVAEHRRAAAAEDGMGGGGKGERRCDDLTVQSKSLYQVLQREMPVRKERDVLRAEIALQRGLKRLVLLAHIRQPVAVPYAAYLRAIFLKLRHGGARNVYQFTHFFGLLSIILPRPTRASPAGSRPCRGQKLVCCSAPAPSSSRRTNRR